MIELAHNVPCCEWCGTEEGDGHTDACPLREDCPICHAPAGTNCVGSTARWSAPHASRHAHQLGLLDELAPGNGSARW